MSKLNTYTTIEAKHLFDDKTPFNIFKMTTISLREFYNRFVKTKGYKAGLLGFFLSLMMGFYRVLTYIKLWEKTKYYDHPVELNYRQLKADIAMEYLDKNR